jgi:hypothetical protein
LEEVAGVGEEGSYQEWFRSPHTLFDDQAPLDACKFAVGNQEVQRILTRIATPDFIA